MRRITKLAIGWNGLLESVAKCVGEWRPTKQSKETAYSRLLAEYLRQSLPEDAHVECEYRHAGETLDLYVLYSGIVSDDEVFIEVKRRLSRKSELNRLVGQISSLHPAKNKMLIVIIGDSDIQLIGRLRRQFKQQLGGASGTVLDVPTMSVVQVQESD
jgi:hypothetical protein